jgi:hypothetical protein
MADYATLSDTAIDAMIVGNDGTFLRQGFRRQKELLLAAQQRRATGKIIVELHLENGSLNATYILRGKRYRLRYRSLRGRAAGWADSPDIRPPKGGRKILLSDRRTPRRSMTDLIHELLHVENWSLDEEWVEHAAEEIARVLWDQGYRYVED